MNLIVLWTDALIYLLVISLFIFILWARRQMPICQAFRQVLKNRLAVVSMVILTVYCSIGLLDSIHFSLQEESTRVKSVFDVLLSPLDKPIEKTYSSPFATHLFVKESVVLSDGKQARLYPRLIYAGRDLKNDAAKWHDLILRIGKGVLLAIIAWGILASLIIFMYGKKQALNFNQSLEKIYSNKMIIPIRLLLMTFLFILIAIFCLTLLASEYHIFGTDKVGQDVFYQTLKSIRTGLVIGSVTTLIMLPFAIFLGISAGYFGRWIDDVIQYVYTTLSSIPGVLLIAAAILSLQVFIAAHPEWFHTLSDRADARLLALCAILGVTSWTGLCRLLRGETLKIREVDYVKAAIALGTNRFKILSRHILPNVMHIVLIAVVLDFSSLVLAEAVLSYVGVGVDPSAISWGNMINSARLELAREPVVWWPLLAAFIFMFLLVLAANLFADAVRDGFDPRNRKEIA